MHSRKIFACFVKSQLNRSNGGAFQKYSTATETLSYVHGIASKPLIFSTVDKILRAQVEQYPDRHVFSFPRQSKHVTYQEFYEDVNNVAAGLLGIGLKKGDRVGMWGPNVYEWVVTQFATSIAGLIMVNINPAYRITEVEYCLEKVGVKCLISANKFKTQNYYEMIAELCPSIQTSTFGNLTGETLPELQYIVFLEDIREKGCITFKDLSALATKENKNLLSSVGEKLQPDEPVNIQFTSQYKTDGDLNIPISRFCKNFEISSCKVYTEICPFKR